MQITKELLNQIVSDAEAQQAQAKELVALASGAIQIAKHLLAELEKPESENGSN